MMKKLLFGLLALTGIAMLNSCQQDEVMNVAQAGRGVTVTATMDNRPQSRVILGETTAAQTDIYWEEGDEFKVTIDNTEYTFTISEEYSDDAPSTTAIFTCTEAPAELPAGTYTFSYEAQSATEQTGTKDGLSAYHSMQATVVTNEAMTWAEVVLEFATQVSIVEVMLPDGVSATKVWLYNAADGTLMANTVNGTFSGRVYFAVAPGTYTGFVLSETSDKTYMAQVASNTLVDGNLYRINKAMTETTDRNNNNDVRHAIFDGTCYVYGMGAMADAISNNTSIENVVVMNGVTTIKESAFSQCSNLGTIILPATITAIGEEAFYLCTGLTEIILPAGVTTIGENAFSACSSLTDIKVDDANTAFKDIEGVLYSKDGKSIMFYPRGKTAATFTLPASVTSIAANAFNSCKIETFEFATGSQLKSVGEYALSYCTNLSSINLPSTVTDIGISAFSGCSKLVSINIPAGVTSIGMSVFQGCSLLETVTFGSGSQLESVGKAAFNGCRKLSSIVLPATVTGIENTAFQYCESLSTITIPSGVTQIKDYVFSNCTDLTTITIPSGVTSIGEYSFYNCTNLASITCQSVTPPSLGNNAFEGISANLVIYVPAGKTTDYQSSWGTGYTFRELIDVTGMNNLQVTEALNSFLATGATDITINLPENTPDDIFPAICNAIDEGTNMINLTLAGSITSIGDYKFMDLEKVASITLPEGLTSIGLRAFQGSEGLQRVNIPASVSSIGDYAFFDCENLAEIAVNDANETYKDVDGVLYTKDGTELIYYPWGKTATSYIIPDGVVEIAKAAFSYCTALTSVTIPNSVINIGDYAFKYCSGLTAITIPANVNSIGLDAFEHCSSLASVTCLPATPPVLVDSYNFAFDDNASGRKIYVPAASVNYYKNATNWNEYASAIEAIQ